MVADDDSDADAEVTVVILSIASSCWVVVSRYFTPIGRSLLAIIVVVVVLVVVVVVVVVIGVVLNRCRTYFIRESRDHTDEDRHS